MRIHFKFLIFLIGYLALLLSCTKKNTTTPATGTSTPPTELTYSGSPFIFTKGLAISSQAPSSKGGEITSCAYEPALPTGMLLSSTCVLSGTPTAVVTTTAYNITASNSGGSTSVSISIAINDIAPAISYSGLLFIFHKNSVLSSQTPSNSGGEIISCESVPTLPLGLSLSSKCVLSGTPTAISASASYTITATNSGGDSTVSISLSVDEAWMNSEWTRRIRITFDNSITPSETQSNIPVLIKLTPSRVSYSDFESSVGNDLRFTDPDGTTLLSYEIEKWEDAGTSLIWVKVPTLDATTSDFIFMYYKHTGTPVGFGADAPNVWTDNYRAVWHMSQTPAAFGTPILDSLGTYHLSTLGLIGASNFSLLSAFIGDGLNFDGTSDYLQNPTVGDLPSSGSFEGWFKLDAVFGTTSTTSQVLMEKYLNGSNEMAIMLVAGSGSGGDYTGSNSSSMDGKLGFKVKSSGNSRYVWGTTSSWLANTWYYFTCIFDATNLTGNNNKVYVNAVDQSTSPSSSPSGNSSLNWAVSESTVGFHIGGKRKMGSTSARYFDGVIDEVKISTTQRSASWINAQRRSMLDSDFATYGSAQTY